MPHGRKRAGSLTLDTRSPTSNSTRSPSPAPPSAHPGHASDHNSKLRLQVLDVTSSAVALSVFTPAPPPAASSSSTASPSTSRSTPCSSSKPPSVSILLDRRPWPHVAHAGSSALPGDSGEAGQETTVIVYGLDPAREYEIGLDVVDGAGEDEEGGAIGAGGDDSRGGAVEIEMGGEGSSSRRPSTDDTPETYSHDHYNDSYPSASPSSHAHSTPDGPPPPYSPSPTAPPVPSSTATSISAPPSASDPHTSSDLSESSLRLALKTLRTTSKRTEQSLLLTLSSLRKTVEKAAKEDQRARTRIVSLEEAIRRAREAEDDMRGRERDEIEERLKELEKVEEETRRELEEWREGRREVRAPAVSTPPPHAGAVKDKEKQVDEPPQADGGEGAAAGAEEDQPRAGESSEGPSLNLAELAKELDALNKAIEAVEKEKAEKAGEVLQTLEREMTIVEGELIQLDREDAHRAAYGTGPVPLIPLHPGHPGIASVVPVAPAPPHTTGPFNFRWRRGGAQAAAAQQQDPRSFGRFFRRNNAAVSANSSTSNSASSSAGNSTLNLNVTTLPASSSPARLSAATDLIPSQVHLHSATNPSERFAAQQQFAHAHQAQALWAQAQAQAQAQGQASTPTLLPRSAYTTGSGGGRRRAGSLNSVVGTGSGAAGSYGALGGSNNSSPSLAHPHLHTSGVQSARTSVDEGSRPFNLAGGGEGSPLGLGSGLQRAESRASSTLGGEEGKEEKEGKGWGRLGTWSQVVGRGVKGKETEAGEDDEGEQGEGEQA
ncbi:hypothetical protein JCM21900_005882 [Sporobolomyces salmonicolor]